MRWLKEGDANSNFFHGWVRKQRRQNEILCLNVEGRNVEEVAEIRSVIQHHFQSRFTSNEDHRPLMSKLNFKRIGEAENNVLVAPFTDDEIKEAVWQCESSKSPRPDGFNFYFIK